MKIVQEKFEIYAGKNQKYILKKISEISNIDVREKWCLRHGIDINDPNLHNEYVLSNTREAFEFFKAGWETHHETAMKNIYHSLEDHV